MRQINSLDRRARLCWVSLVTLLLLTVTTLGSYQSASARVFHYPESSRPMTLMPFFADDMSEVRLLEFLFESLIVINRRGDVEGALAVRWNEAPDQRSITFELREGVKWHDGRPFSADDVLFTIKAAQDPRTVFSEKGQFAFIRSAEKRGANKVQISFTRPIRNSVERFLFKIIPRHKFRRTQIKRTDRFGRSPVGTGPYKLKKYSLRAVKLERFADYWGRASIEGIAMQHTPDESEQINLLKYSGTGAGVQAMIFVPPRSQSNFQGSNSVVLEPYQTVSWWYMAYNHKNPALADSKVREAIALSIDREELLSANLGQGDILSGPFTQSSPFYNFDDVETREVDREAARQLLEQAGYRLRGKVRQRGRNKLKFTFVLDRAVPRVQDIFLSIQSQLREVGIQVESKYVDRSNYWETVFTRKRFDMTINTWTFREVEDIYPLFHSKGDFNFVSFSDREVDRMLDESLRSNDHRTYKSLMSQLHVRLNQQLPYLFLWSLDIYSGLSRSLTNIFIQPYYYFTHFRDWSFR